MDRLDKPLDQLVKDSKADAKSKSKKAPKKAVAAKKKAVPVKAVGKKTAGKVKPMLKKQKIVMPTARNIMDRVGVDRKPKVPKQSTGSAVVFSNLAYNITMDEMKELCSTIGNCGKVFMDVPGKADVMFFNKLDAITAVKKFNGLTLDGRPMNVALKESTVPRRADAVTSKALLFGSMGGSRDQGYGRGGGGPSFSVTMGGRNSQPKKQKTIVVKQAPKKKAEKPKKKAEKPKAPAPKSSEDLNMEMDSYFANRPAKASE